jgi:hypothetical protein
MGESSTAARITPDELSADGAVPSTGTRTGPAAAGAATVICSAWTRSASVSRPWAVDRMTMPSTMAPAPM